MSDPESPRALIPSTAMDPARLAAAESLSERGRMLCALTTSIVRLHVDAFGRGPTAARTDLHDGEYALCLLRDVLTRPESTLLAGGRGDIVRLGREAIYAQLEEQLREIVEEAVQRPVVGFLPSVAAEDGLVTLLFLLGR
jgi:uncharacterized protein YbcI